jgi:hypothetical protein
MPPGGEETARQFYGTALGLREIPPPENLAAMKLVSLCCGTGCSNFSVPDGTCT